MSSGTSSGSRGLTRPKSTPNESDDGSHSGSGLSTDGRLGIGAGIGGAVGVLVIVGIIFFCWRKKQKERDRRLAEMSSSTPGYSPMQTSSSPSATAKEVKQSPRQQESRQSAYSELA